MHYGRSRHVPRSNVNISGECDTGGCRFLDPALMEGWQKRQQDVDQGELVATIRNLALMACWSARRLSDDGPLHGF
jgi:hypothetical protein